jgi:glycosyltransferase involved in cell wall biosynthesis
MILGYDATTLVGQVSGVGYYTARLMESLANGAAEGIVDRLVVLSNREVALPAGGRVDVHEGDRFPVRSVWLQLVLPRILRRLRPDLVHYTNYLAPVAGDTPYVVSVHDMILSLVPEHHTLRKRLLTATLVPVVARRARLVLAPSESTRRDVMQLLGLPARRVRVIPYAPASRFSPRPQEPPPAAAEGAPYFLYVGTLEPRKNLRRVVRAFALVARHLPDHRLLLVGQRGWRYGDVFAEVERRGLARRVVFAGYLPEADLPACYTHAAGFVYASLYEGFGLPVVEAMACGVPVLTSRTSSLGEIAAGAALLVDPLDEGAIAEALLALGSDAGLRADLSRKGLARAAAFSWERTGRETAAAYRDALSEGARGGSGR